MIAFFAGGAVDAIAYDWSDYLFFYVSSLGPLNWWQQQIYYDWIPFLYAASFAFVAFLMGKYTKAGAWPALFFYIIATLSAAIGSLFLPQAQGGWFFDFTIASGTAVAVSLTLGVAHRVGHFRRL